MADDHPPDAAASGPDLPSAPAAAGPACPWCSAPLPDPAATVCPSCDARLVEEGDVEIPGVTSVAMDLRASAAAPRRVRSTFGALFVGDDDEIPLPSEAEMPALAPPDDEVRREMLRLELEARLRDLRAEVRSLDSEEAMTGPGSPGPPTPPAGTLPPEADER
jgi:hypothetical protein